VGALTPEDRATIALALGGRPVDLIPDGADHLHPAPTAPGAEMAAVFVANFAYAPNVDAALHLCRDIVPLVRARVPDLCVWLVGNDPPDAVRALAGEHVTVTGWVPDIAPYLDLATVLVCPLRIGGGIKVKTIEALRRGRALVTTPVGAQGLPSEARRAVLIADTPEAFASSLVRVLGQPDVRRLLERRARRAGGVLPSWNDAAAALTRVYNELLGRTTAGRRREAMTV
jgi:glycosyltransferase involved in cell wall biosynthesis